MMTTAGLFIFTAASIVPAWWTHEGKQDPMTDRYSCVAHAGNLEPGAPALLFFEGGEGATIMGDKYPGSEVLFRVDDNEAIRSTDQRVSGPLLRMLHEQMIPGFRLRTRFDEFPSNASVDRAFDLDGVDEAIAACRSYVTEGVQRRTSSK